MRGVLLALCATATPALADVAGPDAVFDGGWDCRPYALGIPGWLDCLAAEGASDAAVAFAARLAAPLPPDGDGYDLPGVLTAFTETGEVDVGTVVFPDLANSNEQMLFLNGEPAILHPYDVVGGVAPDDPTSRAMRTRHPELFAMGQAVIGAHRRLPDGTQRFVIWDVLVDGCRACEVLGLAVAEVDFADGRLAGSRVLGWVPEDPDEDTLRPRLLAGDVAVLQLQLNLAGYGAGPMDGRAGEETSAAWAAFLADHCLPSAAAPDPASADALVAAADGAPAPCAP